MRGGKPYGIEVTGYYDNEGNLMDFKINNKVDAEKYFEKHKISLEPPGTLIKQLVDLFTYDPNYVKKAEKRIGYVLDAPEVEIIDGKKIYTTPSNRLDKRTKYIVVNTEDDIKRININNELIKKLAEMAKEKNKKTGGTGNDITKFNEITSQINVNDIFKDDEEKKIAEKILKSPGFMRLVKTYFSDQFSDNIIPLDQPLVQGTEPPVQGTEPPVQGTEPPVQGTEQPVQSTQPDKIDKLVELVEKLSQQVNELAIKVDNKPSTNNVYAAKNATNMENMVKNAKTKFGEKIGNTARNAKAKFESAKTKLATTLRSKLSKPIETTSLINSDEYKQLSEEQQQRERSILFNKMNDNDRDEYRGGNKTKKTNKRIKPKRKRVRKTRRLR